MDIQSEIEEYYKVYRREPYYIYGRLSEGCSKNIKIDEMELSNDSFYSFNYAILVLNSRFIIAEKNIFNSMEFGLGYNIAVIIKPIIKILYL